MRPFSTKRTRLKDVIKKMPNLIVYFPLNELSGNAINNAPANINSLNGTVTGTTQGAASGMGRAYSFNGTNNDVTIGTIGTLDNFTIGFLLKTTESNTVRAVMGLVEDGTNEVIQILLNTDQLEAAGAGKTFAHVRFNGSVQDSFCFTNSAVYDGNFHLHLLTRNGDTTAYYVDGTSQTLTDNQTNLGTQQLTLGRPFSFGGRNNRGTVDRYANITLQHAFVVGDVLTTSQIKKLTHSARLS